jgi:hypothetical protein
MWNLHMAGRGQPWVTVGSFDTVAAAACKIIELEAYSVTGVCLEGLIETGLGALKEEESFDHLEHTGKSGRCYVIKKNKALVCAAKVCALKSARKIDGTHQTGGALNGVYLAKKKMIIISLWL